MAVTADYGTADPEKGIYGIYNDFFVRLTTDTVGGVKFAYRIKVTAVNASPALEIIQDVEPITSTREIAVNPVEVMRDAYFKEQVIGGENNAALDSSNGVANFAYNQIQVEIGELFAASIDLAPTFPGYDTDDSFYFYNGYEDVFDEPVLDEYENYRDLGWYDQAGTIKLPIENKDIYQPSIGGFNRISIPNIIEMETDQYLIKNVVDTSYDLAGTPTVNTVDISSDFSTDGYWVIGTQTGLNPATVSKVEYYFQYENQTDSSLLDTEVVTYYPIKCTPHKVWQIRYFNKYSGFEYITFNGKSVWRQQIIKGKVINDGGVNYSAGSFGAIKYIASPEKRPYGDSVKKFLTLNSNWLTQSEVDALASLYKTRNAFLINLTDADVYSALVQSSSYEIINTRDKMAQVAVTFEIANFGKIQTQ